VVTVTTAAPATAATATAVTITSAAVIDLVTAAATTTVSTGAFLFVVAICFAAQASLLNATLLVNGIIGGLDYDYGVTDGVGCICEQCRPSHVPVTQRMLHKDTLNGLSYAQRKALYLVGIYIFFQSVEAFFVAVNVEGGVFVRNQFLLMCRETSTLCDVLQVLIRMH
jgi:hypothetical protein